MCYKLEDTPLVPPKYGLIVLPATEEQDIYDSTFDLEVYSMLQNIEDNPQHYKIESKDESDEGIYYNGIWSGDPKRTFIFFFLESEAKKEALLILTASKPTKVWINYKLYTIVNMPNRMLVASLMPGVNTIALECLNTTREDHAFIRVSDYKREKEKSDLPCLFQGDMHYHEHFGLIRHSGSHLYNGQPFEFAFFPNHDVYAKNSTFSFQLLDYKTNELILIKEFRTNHKCSVDLPGPPFDDYDQGHYFVAEIRYAYENNYEHYEKIFLYTQPVDKMLENTCQDAAEVLVSIDHNYDKLCLNCDISYIKDESHDLPSKLTHMRLLRSNACNIRNGKHCDEGIYDSGSKRVFFFNPMYDTVNFYRIWLPADYCNEKKYPLVVIHATFEYNVWNHLFAHYFNEPVIAVDVSGRGFLLGSYISEAAIKIALKDILSRFSIDENRIYATGYSNGACATWAVAESYPDLFAGIYVVSGNANFNLLGNLNNMRILHLSSPSDGPYRTCQQISNELANHNDYHDYFPDGFTHNSLLRLWFNEKMFAKLFEAHRDKSPSHVVYRTLRNRHRKAYWVEIHSIANGSTEGMIDAQIASPNRIDVLCSGITGFTITVPEHICKEFFEISINGDALYLFQDKSIKNIHFTQIVENSKSSFNVAETYTPLKDLHKGSGLLDVYFDPLSIVIPCQNTDIVKKVAVGYSEPHCQGLVPKIYINYPIINHDELSNARDIGERSYVIIDDGSEHAILQELRKTAEIICDPSGWEYNHKKHSGKYCVQQIINSPWNPARNVHLISYNDEIMLRKNLFTRQLIIPTYINGRHPFLNNDALIYDENGYHGILDYSCDVVDL